MIVLKRPAYIQVAIHVWRRSTLDGHCPDTIEEIATAIGRNKVKTGQYLSALRQMGVVAGSRDSHNLYHSRGNDVEILLDADDRPLVYQGVTIQPGVTYRLSRVTKQFRPGTIGEFLSHPDNLRMIVRDLCLVTDPDTDRISTKLCCKVIQRHHACNYQTASYMLASIAQAGYLTPVKANVSVIGYRVHITRQDELRIMLKISDNACIRLCRAVKVLEESVNPETSRTQSVTRKQEAEFYMHDVEASSFTGAYEIVYKRLRQHCVVYAVLLRNLRENNRVARQSDV